MGLSPGATKLALTAHVALSVAWLGAVASFLALAVAGLRSTDTGIVRACYVAMDPITWWVIVPLALASLVTGVVQSLGTTWGLFRHYWIVAKLLLTVLATAVLLLHTGPIGRVALAAANESLAAPELDRLRMQLVADAIGAVIALLVATALSIYKPRGLTFYGRLHQFGSDLAPVPHSGRPAFGRYVMFAFLALLLLVLLAHLMGGGFHH